MNVDFRKNRSYTITEIGLNVHTFLRKNSLSISLLLLLIILISAWRFPSVTSILAVSLLLFSIAIAISSILEKHEATPPEEMRRKIAKDIIILMVSIIVAVTVGGIVGQFVGIHAQGYARIHWPGLDMTAGLLAAVLAAFVTGFFIRRGILKATRS